jgi:hypothetical protein
MTHAARAMAPVFIVGGPRSGTAWLYHLLLSSGGFAVFLAESGIFNRLGPRFGDLAVSSRRARLLDAWLPSEGFRQSGLDATAFRRTVHERCRSAGDLLRLLMDGMAQQQEVSRWAECSPENLLHVGAIKQSIPDALFLHIVRDGRDVACSLARQTAPAGGSSELLRSALYWEWMLRRGREQIRQCGPDALEVRFEGLVAQPRETLAAIGAFLAHDLDYDRISQQALGTVREPNTNFAVDAVGQVFRPVGRWQRGLSVRRLARLEAAIGGLLEELGYALYTDEIARQRVRNDVQFRRSLAQLYFSSWHWLKTRTPFGRMFTRDGALDPLTADDAARPSLAPRKHTV